MSGPLLLPAQDCLHWVAGRCLLEEALNPGLQRDFQCIVLNLLITRFDSFVLRGELLGLSAEEAGRIWEQRMASLNMDAECASFTFLADAEEDLPCLHFLDGLCLLRLPPCPGRCRKYSPRRRSKLRNEETR